MSSQLHICWKRAQTLLMSIGLHTVTLKRMFPRIRASGRMLAVRQERSNSNCKFTGTKSPHIQFDKQIPSLAKEKRPRTWLQPQAISMPASKSKSCAICRIHGVARSVGSPSAVMRTTRYSLSANDSLSKTPNACLCESGHRAIP